MSITSNLGDTRTTLTNPATTTHSKLLKKSGRLQGSRDGMIRVSTGLEHIDDIKADFEQAIGQSK